VDGEGEEGKWKVDSEELSRLAKNISMPGRSPKAEKPNKAEKTMEVKVSAQKINAVMVEEKGSWVQSAAGIGALLVCGTAWIAGSLGRKR